MANSHRRPERMLAHVVFTRPVEIPDIPDARELKKLLATMAADGTGRNFDSIDLIILDDGAIANINFSFLGLPGPTNILSFPDPAAFSGTLFLSLDTLLRESFLYGQKPVIHLIRLLAHGLAHLNGLDHGPRLEALENAYYEAGLSCLALR